MYDTVKARIASLQRILEKVVDNDVKEELEKELDFLREVKNKLCIEAYIDVFLTGKCPGMKHVSVCYSPGMVYEKDKDHHNDSVVALAEFECTVYAALAQVDPNIRQVHWYLSAADATTMPGKLSGGRLWTNDGEEISSNMLLDIQENRMSFTKEQLLCMEKIDKLLNAPVLNPRNMGSWQDCLHEAEKHSNVSYLT